MKKQKTKKVISIIAIMLMVITVHSAMIAAVKNISIEYLKIYAETRNYARYEKYPGNHIDDLRSVVQEAVDKTVDIGIVEIVRSVSIIQIVSSVIEKKDIIDEAFIVEEKYPALSEESRERIKEVTKGSYFDSQHARVYYGIYNGAELYSSGGDTGGTSVGVMIVDGVSIEAIDSGISVLKDGKVYDLERDLGYIYKHNILRREDVMRLAMRVYARTLYIYEKYGKKSGATAHDLYWMQDVGE